MVAKDEELTLEQIITTMWRAQNPIPADEPIYVHPPAGCKVSEKPAGDAVPEVR
jgi:hypothetical protein